MIAILFIIPGALALIGYSVADMSGIGVIGQSISALAGAALGLLMLLGD